MTADPRNDIEQLLAAADPVDPADFSGIDHDARADADRSRILATPRPDPRHRTRAVSLAIAATLVLGVLVGLALTGAFSSTSAEATPPGILTRTTTTQD